MPGGDGRRKNPKPHQRLAGSITESPQPRAGARGKAAATTPIVDWIDEFIAARCGKPVAARPSEKSVAAGLRLSPHFAGPQRVGG
jgi:hypothetical protein